MYKMYSFHGFARNVETVRFISFLPVANPEISLHVGKDNSLWQYFSNTRNFLTRNFSENCECYVLFESSVFEIKEL